MSWAQRGVPYTRGPVSAALQPSPASRQRLEEVQRAPIDCGPSPWQCSRRAPAQGLFGVGGWWYFRGYRPRQRRKTSATSPASPGNSPEGQKGRQPSGLMTRPRYLQWVAKHPLRGGYGRVVMATIEAKLQELGLELPEPLKLPRGVVLPFPWVRVRGNRAFVSGHGPQSADGSLAAPFGKVGGRHLPRAGPALGPPHRPGDARQPQAGAGRSRSGHGLASGVRHGSILRRASINNPPSSTASAS